MEGTASSRRGRPRERHLVLTAVSGGMASAGAVWRCGRPRPPCRSSPSRRRSSSHRHLPSPCRRATLPHRPPLSLHPRSRSRRALPLRQPRTRRPRLGRRGAPRFRPREHRHRRRPPPSPAIRTGGPAYRARPRPPGRRRCPATPTGRLPLRSPRRARSPLLCRDRGTGRSSRQDPLARCRQLRRRSRRTGRPCRPDRLPRRSPS
jgi:hypothetical protein